MLAPEVAAFSWNATLYCKCGAAALDSNGRLSKAHSFRTLQRAGARENVQHWQWETSLASEETYRLLQAGPLYKPSWHLSSCRLSNRWLHMQVHHTINARRHQMSSPPSSPRSETSRRGSAESLHRLTPMPSAAMSWQRGCGSTQKHGSLAAGHAFISIPCAHCTYLSNHTEARQFYDAPSHEPVMMARLIPSLQSTPMWF